MRNLINQDEVELHLKELLKSFPELSGWISSKLKNYLLKKHPVKVVDPESINPLPTWFKSGTELHRVDLNIDKLELMCRYVKVYPKYIERTIEECEKVALENPIFLIRADGFFWQELRSQESLTKESNEMHHCVRGYHSAVVSGNTKIYSLRTSEGIARCTVEFKQGTIKQVVSEYNQDHRYRDYNAIVELSEKLQVPYTELKPLVNPPYYLLYASLLSAGLGWNYSAYFYIVSAALFMRYLHYNFSSK